MEDQQPLVKPGTQTTEFWGKCVLQALAVINAVLKAAKLPSVDVSPEMSLSIAAGLEGLYMTYRSWQKKHADDNNTKAVVSDNELQSAKELNS